MKSVITILVILLMSSVAFAQDGSLTGTYKFNTKEGTWGELVFLEQMVQTQEGKSVQGARFTLDLNEHGGYGGYLPDTDAKDHRIGAVFAVKISDSKYMFKGKVDDGICALIFDFSKNETVKIIAGEGGCDAFGPGNDGGAYFNKTFNNRTFKKTSDKAVFK